MRPNIFLADAMTKKILFWLGVCIVSLLVMVRPASATAGIKSAIFPTCYSSWIEIPVNVEITINGYLYKNTSCNSVSCSIQVFSPPGYTGWVNNVPPTINHSACTLAAVCPAAETALSAGMYDIGYSFKGASGNGLPPTFICTTGGCKARFYGRLAAKYIVGGQYHYYAQGGYLHLGEQCDPALFAPEQIALTAPPVQTCGSNQTSNLVDGKLLCIDNATGQMVGLNNASAVADAKVLSDARGVLRIGDAESIATAAGLDAASIAAAKAAAAAAAAGSTSDNPYDPSDPMHQYCVDNPTADICQKKTACDKNPNLLMCLSVDVPVGLTAVSDVDLIVKTVNVSSITPFAVGGASVCPAPRAITLAGHTYFMPFTIICSFANGLRPILLASAWLSAAGLLVGGIKTA